MTTGLHLPEVAILASETPADRAGNVGMILLFILTLAGIGLAGWLIASLGGRLVRMGWPLWLVGGAGALVVLAGYIGGSSGGMKVGGSIMAGALGLAIWAYLMGAAD